MPDYMSADELSGDMQLKDWLNYWLENYVKPVTEATAFTGTQSHVKHYGNAKIETIAEEVALDNVQQFQLLRDG